VSVAGVRANLDDTILFSIEIKREASCLSDSNQQYSQLHSLEHSCPYFERYVVADVHEWAVWSQVKVIMALWLYN
jgi:hypothetical protein